jgi:hypothetical protein
LLLETRIPVGFLALDKVKRHLVIEITIKLRPFPERLYSRPGFVKPLRDHGLLLRS